MECHTRPTGWPPATRLIVEDETQGNARDRWWKAAHQRTYLQSGDFGSDETTAYLSAIAEVHAANLRLAAQEAPSLSDEWGDVGAMNDYWLLLTPEQTAAMLEDLHEVVSRYRSHEDVDGAPETARRAPFSSRRFVPRVTKHEQHQRCSTVPAQSVRLSPHIRRLRRGHPRLGDRDPVVRPGGISAAAARAAFGLAPALVIAGGIYLAATLVPGLRPEWKEMDRERQSTNEAQEQTAAA